MGKANLRGIVRKPFLFIKEKLHKAKILQSYKNKTKRPIVILEKKNSLYEELLFAQRQKNPNEEKINNLKGWLECIAWLVE